MKIFKELLKGIREAAFIVCVIMIIVGIFVTMASEEYDQLDGIAIILGFGLLLPFTRKNK